MSRIHEALKKAEQERLESPPPSPAPSIEELPIGSLAATPVTNSTATAVRSARSVSDAGALSHSDLLVQCPKPEWKPDPRSVLFMNDDSHHAIGMEEFRTLRSRLYRIREHTEMKTLLVGSALPAEGKSFVSINLAQVLSRQKGRRVLLIDGDLRAPRIHKYLGAPLSPGLTDYLRGDASELEIMQQSSSENLFFMPCGTAMASPAELLSGGQMEKLMQKMRKLFDWIVIDSSPILPVSDAGLLSQCCDGVLLVVLASKTPAEMVKRACNEFKDRPLLGVVLNRATSKARFGAYAYYGRYAKAYGAPEEVGANNS